jgi:pectin methylesterase-like acyl-CoA thioesterase
MIKRRNLSPSLVNWIMTESGLGPGIGHIRYLVATSTAYRTQLGDLGVDESDMYTDLLTAYNATTTDRNDIIFVMPGVYEVTAAVAWSKSHVHMIGLAGPLISGDWTTADSCVIYTDTITVADVITLTGHGCIFKNLVIENYGANAANVSAVRVAGYGDRKSTRLNSSHTT